MYFSRNDDRTESCFMTILEESGIVHMRSDIAYQWDYHPEGSWLVVRHPDAESLEQGWKLHISANLDSAPEVLRRSLKVLLADPVAFKVARSPQYLVGLNQGEGGMSQIGKFMTIYPADDAQAVRLAIALDEATRGLAGPTIASDRQLSPGSLVHYRYGGFRGMSYLQNSIGQIVSGIRAPDGSLVPDRRLLQFQPPSWAEDPFEKAGMVTPVPAPQKVIHRRYLHLTTMYRSSRSAVHLVVDAAGGRRCVLKEMRQDMTFAETGIPISEGLRREAATLRALAPDPRFPEIFELFEENHRLYMAMEDVEGQTFEKTVIAIRQQHALPSNNLLRQWGIEMAELVGCIHAAGYAYRDLKSANLMVAPEGRLRLIDFDLATPLGELPLSPGSGTRGYMTERQSKGGEATEADDLYGIGALLYFAATGAEPSVAPDPFNLLNRPLLTLNPDLHPALAVIIERCLAPNSSDRYATTAPLLKALLALDLTAEIPSPPAPALRSPAHYQSRAEQLGETLLSVALPVLEGEGLAWLSKHKSGAGLFSRDINSGTGGGLLAILDLAKATGDPRYYAAAQKGAAWLAAAPAPEGAIVPGLYVGEAGRVFLYGRVAEQLNDEQWRQKAIEASHILATLPYESPDLFNGTAGRLRTHLDLWRITGDPTQLAYTRNAGEALLAAATHETHEGNGETYWVIPDGFETLSGKTYSGYAHGVAGIADTLIDLYLIEPEERYRHAIQGAFAWLTRHAMPLSHDNEAVVWGQTPGQLPTPSYWCHGAAGIGLFLLRAGQSGIVPDGIEWAARAARTVSRWSRWVGPTPCHGLAGNIELLLQLYTATGEEGYHREAHLLGGLLDTYGVESDGNLAWSSESPAVFTPDYMVGYGGVVTALLRLANPHFPHPLHPSLSQLRTPSPEALLRGATP
jgi:hypothetical protein